MNLPLTGLNFKKSNIRIWIHQRNMANLQQVVWEGHGGMLLVEHSNNPKIKRFLEAIPHILGLIKEIHLDVQNDDLEKLKERVSPPTPPIVLSGKDVNGLTPLHKAAGLDKKNIAEYIIQEYPESINCIDNEGRTPLHYAALLKDDGKMTNFLIQHGADESILDHKQKTAAYYKSRHSEIDSKLLNVVPDCPRSAKESFAANFDWNILSSSPSLNWIQNGTKKALEQVEIKNNDEEHDETMNNHENHNGNEENVEPVQNGESKSPVLIENAEDSKENDEPEALNDVEESNDSKPSEPEPEPEENPESGQQSVPESHEGEEKEAAVEEEDDKNKSANGESIENKDDTNEEEITDNNNNDTEGLESEDTKEEENTEEPKSRPVSHTTRPNSSNEAVKSRPSSQKSRPASNLQEKSRPASNLQEKSRPASNLQENSRPSSKTLEKNVPPVEEGEGIIEGIVNGENEVEAMDNEGMNEPRASDKDEDVKVLVDAGNMEQLAAMVLNGEGARLVGMNSDNPELQTFLENVPTYMSKIHKIHEAARAGSLRNLQAALDRRKFAIAKDNISPKGASPLHVAVIFGNTSIVRYLAGRFPETLQMVDDEGKTPLHYAAVLNDNGHYYNLLVHLGADMRAEDKFGFSPEYYRKNQQDFNHKSLLRDFGAEEEETEEILADKVSNDTHSSRKNLDDEDMLVVLERCYHLLQTRRGSTISTTSANPTPSTKPAGFLLNKHARKFTFDTVKLRVTKLDNNLYDIIWPSVKKLPTDPSFRVCLEQDFPMGIAIPDFSCYYVFKEFLDPILKDYNHLDINNNYPDQPRMSFMEAENVDIDKDLDPSGKNILSGTLEASRNIEGFDLPKYLNTSQLELVERIITTVIMSKEVAKALYPLTPENEIEEKGSGTYYTINEILDEPSEIKIQLASNNLLIPLWNLPDSDRLHGKYWPYGRGVFISNSANLAIWINVLDHIRIVTRTDSSHPGNVGQVYSRMSRVAKVLEDNLNFLFDEKLGYLSARPSVIGNTLKFNLTMRFPHLIKEPDNLRHLCVVRGLSYHRNTSTSDVVKTGNQQCLGVTELQTFEDFTMAVVNILQLEKDLAMSNSLHIATMFLNIFKKKKLAQSA